MFEARTPCHERRIKWSALRRVPDAVRQCWSNRGHKPNQTVDAAIDSTAANLFKLLHESVTVVSTSGPNAQLFDAVVRSVARGVTPGAEQVELTDLRTVVSQLPDSTRQALQLHLLRGLSYREIAQALNIPASESLVILKAAYVRLHRACMREKPPSSADASL